MSKYLFPAIFTQEQNGIYSVKFPDLESCYTQGDNLQDAYEMAEDALCLCLYDMEESNIEIPKALIPSKINTPANSFISLIAANTMEYRKLNSNSAVKKTLTIPQWLNTMAEREGINFSSVLQSSLKKRLGVKLK